MIMITLFKIFEELKKEKKHLSEFTETDWILLKRGDIILTELGDAEVLSYNYNSKPCDRLFYY